MKRPESDESVEDAAAKWLVRRDAGLAPAEEVEFERWQGADPRRKAAFAEMAAAFGALGRPRARGGADRVLGDVQRWQERRQRRGRTLLAASLGAATLLVFALLPALRTRLESEPAPATIVLWQPERRTLADGSIVELNLGAEIHVEFSAATRTVRLLRGEAHFKVTKDPTRPFVVESGRVSVRAVGTAFLVRLESEAIDVLVTEGRVTLARSGGLGPVGDGEIVEPMAPVFLDAGSRLALTCAGKVSAPLEIQTLPAAVIDAALAWRGPRFEFSGTPLVDAVASFSRHSSVRITLGDPSIHHLRLSGVYLAGNPDGFVRLLESTHGLRAEKTGARDYVLHRAP